MQQQSKVGSGRWLSIEKRASLSGLHDGQLSFEDAFLSWVSIKQVQTPKRHTRQSTENKGHAKAQKSTGAAGCPRHGMELRLVGLLALIRCCLWAARLAWAVGYGSDWFGLD